MGPERLSVNIASVAYFSVCLGKLLNLSMSLTSYLQSRGCNTTYIGGLLCGLKELIQLNTYSDIIKKCHFKTIIWVSYCGLAEDF